jgi:hypothetical protein
MERCVSAMIRQNRVTPKRNSPVDPARSARGEREGGAAAPRFALGLSMCPNGRVMVDEVGRPLVAEEVPMRLRFARSVRISMEGNGHFCRGLLATRYDDEGGGVHDVMQFTNSTTRNP